MKKLLSIIIIIAAVPFLLCSCFTAEIESISLSDTDLILTVGDSASLELTVEPEEAEAKKLTWTTSDSEVVTVNDGTLKAKSAGQAVVTVTAENGVNKSCNVTVNDKEIAEIILSNSSTSVKVGKKIQITAKVQPSDAPSDGIEWLSTDEFIATVNSDGYVKGVSEGVVNIICRAPNGTEATCSVTVKSDGGTQTKNSVPATTSPSNPSTSPSTSKPDSTDSSDFVFPDSSVRKLTDSEIARLSSDEVQRAINEIYARNGYVFKTKEIRDYYESKSWYSADPGFSEGDLNSFESYNIALLSKYR